MRLILGFTGVKQAGKTTSFNFVKEQFPEVTEIALANKLKNVCSEVFGVPRAAFDDPKVKEVELDNLIYLDEQNVSAVISLFGFTPDFNKNIRAHLCKVLHTPREIAQYVGTEVLRTVSEDVHCEGSLLGLPEDGIIVVTDIRFPNEYSFFRERFGSNFHAFYICNYGAEVISKNDSHASERHILDIAKKCQIIDNNGSLEDLKRNVLSALGPVIATHKEQK